MQEQGEWVPSECGAVDVGAGELEAEVSEIDGGEGETGAG